MSLQSAHRFVHQMPFFFVARFPNFVAVLRTRYESSLPPSSHRSICRAFGGARETDIKAERERGTRKRVVNLYFVCCFFLRCSVFLFEYKKNKNKVKGRSMWTHTHLHHLFAGHQLDNKIEFSNGRHRVPMLNVLQLDVKRLFMAFVCVDRLVLWLGPAFHHILNATDLYILVMSVVAARWLLVVSNSEYYLSASAAVSEQFDKGLLLDWIFPPFVFFIR